MFYFFNTFAQISFQTSNMETRGPGVMTKTFQVQYGATE